MTLEYEGRFEALAWQARELRKLDARRRLAKLKALPLTPEEFDRRVEELLAQADELAPPEEREAARRPALAKRRGCFQRPDRRPPARKIDRQTTTRRARPTAVEPERGSAPGRGATRSSRLRSMAITAAGSSIITEHDPMSKTKTDETDHRPADDDVAPAGTPSGDLAREIDRLGAALRLTPEQRAAARLSAAAVSSKPAGGDG